MSDWANEYITLIDDCEKRESRLSDWERQFIDGVRSRIERGIRPTQRESDKLDEVWEKATSRG